MQIDRNGTRAVVAPGEPVTVAFAGSIRPKLQQLVTEGVSEIVFDLSQVELVDSCGIGLLIATHNSLAKTGGGLRVVGASPEIRHLFKAMRLDRHFAVEGKSDGGSES